MSYIYLASPYTHPTLSVRRGRYAAAEAATHWLLTQKLWVFSPIVHCHFLAENHELPTGADFWLPYCKAMLKPAKALMLLDIEGLDDSYGCKEEAKMAEEFNILTFYLTPENNTYDITATRKAKP